MCLGFALHNLFTSKCGKMDSWTWHFQIGRTMVCPCRNSRRPHQIQYCHFHINELLASEYNGGRLLGAIIPNAFIWQFPIKLTPPSISIKRVWFFFRFFRMWFVPSPFSHCMGARKSAVQRVLAPGWSLSLSHRALIQSTAALSIANAYPSLFNKRRYTESERERGEWERERDMKWMTKWPNSRARRSAWMTSKNMQRPFVTLSPIAMVSRHGFISTVNNTSSRLTSGWPHWAFKLISYCCCTDIVATTTLVGVYCRPTFSREWWNEDRIRTYFTTRH